MTGRAFEQRGFTLVELILVIVMLGILSGVAAPKFFSLLQYNQHFYFNDILQSVRYAQKLAVVSGCDTQVFTTSQTLVIKRRESCTTGAFTQNVRDPGGGGSVFSRTWPNTVVLNSSENDLYFDSLGRAHATSSGNVSDVVVSVNTRTFNIVGETGLTYEPSN